MPCLASLAGTVRHLLGSTIQNSSWELIICLASIPVRDGNTWQFHFLLNCQFWKPWVISLLMNMKEFVDFNRERCAIWLSPCPAKPAHCLQIEQCFIAFGPSASMADDQCSWESKSKTSGGLTFGKPSIRGCCAATSVGERSRCQLALIHEQQRIWSSSSSFEIKYLELALVLPFVNFGWLFL